MNRVTLRRQLLSDEGTFGVFCVDKLKFFSGELPWRENRSGLSCIPEGVYECKWGYSPKLQRFCYHVEDVSNRSGILIHAANFMGDVEKGFKSELNGCIALGILQGSIFGQRVILRSRDAMRRFEQYIAQESFVLEIQMPLQPLPL